MKLRKNQSDASEGNSVDAGVGKKRRRDGRGWGPFSGGQLTIMVVTIAVMIMLPVGAFAVVSGSNVFVTDSVSGKQARVSASGELVTSTSQSALIAFGTTSAPSFATTPIFSNVSVKNYRDVRLFISETGANPAAQIVNLYSSVVPYVLDNFVMNTADVTRLYELPGTLISLAVSNNDSNPATYTWRVYARTN